MPVDLTAEFEAPAAPAPVDLGSEFEAPHSTEQHAVINDSAEKARLFKRAFDPALPKDQQTAAARDVLGKMVDSFAEDFEPTSPLLFKSNKESLKATLLKNWEDANKPLLELPTAPADTPDIPVPGSPVRLPILAGAYNGVAPLISGFTSPLSIGTLGTFGALTKLAEGAGPVARLANAGLSTIKSFFAAEMAKGAGEAAGRASVPDGKSDQEQTSDIVSTLANAGLAILAGKSATEVEPATRGAATNPNAVKEAIDGAPEKPVDIGPRDETVSTGNGIPTPKEEVMLAEQKRLVDEHLAANKPKLAEEFEAPPPESEAHQVITEELAKQEKPVPTPAVEEPAPKLAEEHTAPEDGVTGIRNAIVDQERKERGLPPAMEEAAREHPDVWNKVSEKLNEDPEAAAKLVNDLNEYPRATTDFESALLLHRQIDLQNQFDKLTDRVVNGAEGATPETLAADRIQLAKVSDDLLDTYNADKTGGRETGRGLNARKMLANEDFSLAKMVTVERANTGKPLTEKATQEITALHEKIKATQKAFDDYRATAEAAQKATKGTKAIRKVVVSYIGERANEARARIKARLAEGRQMSGIDPSELKDYAIVGAEHLTKALDTGIDWAESMVSEFGERIRPHLDKIKEMAEQEKDASDWMADLDAKKKRLEARIVELTRKVDEGDTSASPVKSNRPSTPEIEKLEQTRDDLSGQLTRMRENEAKVKELETAIAEKERKISEGDLSAKGQPVNRPAGDSAVEKLKQERDALNRDLTEARKEAAKPTEEDTMAKKLEAMNEKIAEKKAALASGDIAPKPIAANRPLPEELEKAKQEIEGLNAQIAEARNPAKTPEQKRITAIESQIAKVERQIESGEIFPKGSKESLTSPAIKAAEKKLADLEYERDNLRQTLQPKAEPRIPMTPEERRLSAYKKSRERVAKAYRERTANQDFDPRAKPEPIKLDEEATRLRADAERAKQEFQTRQIQHRLDARSGIEKAADTLVRWRRGFLLSGPITLAKLTGAAVLRMGITPAEEVVGSGLSKLAPDVFDKAPRHGGGFNSRAEAEAITSVWTKGIADAGKKLKTAKSDLDVLFGKGANVRESDVIPQSLIDFFGNLHGALKAPVMRSEFERSMVKRMEFAIRNGTDVSDPMVQTKIAVAAYKDSQRAIFMQDNVLSKAFNMMVSGLENAKVNGQRSAVGKTVATGMRLLLPIVKVPSNIVAEAAEYAVGSVTGSVELANAYRKGIENLTPEQADSIARQLKKGSLGGAALLLGYFNSQNFGGFYQQGEQRNKKDVKPGDARIGGQDIGKSLIHASLVEAIQLGATVRRIQQDKVKGHRAGLGEAIGESALGLAEELPFIKTPVELSKLLNKNERAYAEGELVKGLVVPQALSQPAALLDRDAKGNPISRKPRTVLEHVKTGVPGLRQQVPKRN